MTRRRWFMAAFAAALAVGGGAVLVLRALSRGLPDPRPLADPAWVRQRFDLKDWTTLDQVSDVAVRAILLSEDDEFFEHHGLRLDEMGHAAWEDLLAMRYRRGASSLTQQVVKNAFLTKEKTLRRKVRELMLARRADALVGKRRLLEDYLNLAEWGPHHERGIAWAASAYFGERPDQLSAKEGALLAWLLPDPRLRSRWIRQGELPTRARRHVRVLLDRLVREGSLTEAQAEAERARPFPFERNPMPPTASGAKR